MHIITIKYKIIMKIFFIAWCNIIYFYKYHIYPIFCQKVNKHKNVRHNVKIKENQCLFFFFVYLQ